MFIGYCLLVIEVNVYWLVFMGYWLEGIEGIELRVYWLWVIGYGLLRGLEEGLGVGHLIKMLPRVIISDFLCKFAA